MKTSRLFVAAMTVFSGLVATSCSNNETFEGTPGVDQAPEGYVMLKIDHSALNQKALRLRATDPGIEAEKQINSLHVYLFNQDGTGSPTVVHLSSTQFLTNSSGTTTLAEPIRTSMKDKFGYIGVNLTSAMQSQISSLRNNLTNQGFEQAITDLANVSESSFVMFTDELNISADEIKPTTSDANASPVSASLKRLTSKAAVYYNNTIFDGAGTYAEDEVEFAWRRINKKTYFVQKADYSDPNYNPGDLVAADRNDTQAYAPVNAIDDISTFQYTTENTFDYNATTPRPILTDDATCISIRVPFQPSNYTVKNGNDWEPEANTSTPSSNGPDFYVVNVNNGIAYYFQTDALAQQFWTEATNGDITINGVALVPDDSTYTSRQYVNGMCYYNVYPNYNGTAYSLTNRYNILRNQYYRMALNKLTAPGDPDWDFDKEKPITEYGYIQFNLTVEDWELIDEGIDM